MARTAKRRWLKSIGLLLSLAGLMVSAELIYGCAAMGTAANGRRLDRVRGSPNYKDGVFVNGLPDRTMAKASKLSLLWEWIKGAEHTTPAKPIPLAKRRAADFAEAPPSGLRITWLGHSTTLVELDGQRFLLDPIWSKRASPFATLGPKRFHPPPLPLDELPELDAVVISHDHYDHLDQRTIVALHRQGVKRFIVPLGVGAHLEHWDVPRDKIVELDWWDAIEVGKVKLVATPARHFSGRSVTMSDRDRTLWAGWALLGPGHRVYYSGDSAMFPGFGEIGRRLGPFDVTMIETGAYDARWADVHLGPEQAVQAHRDVRGALLIPVHWGTFNLALHGWTEPVERLLVAARGAGVKVAVPRPGQSIEPAGTPAVAAPKAIDPVRWWPELPWRTASQHPVRSTGLVPARARDTK